MQEPEPLPDKRCFEAAVGRMIIAWNSAESVMRGLLFTLANEGSVRSGLRTNILTAELGSIGLEHALQSFAENVLDDESGKAVKHAVSLYERLRAYRNFYGHGISFVLETPHMGAVGPIQSVTAKGKLVEHRDMADVERLDWLTAQCRTLFTFAANLLAHLDPRPDGERPPLPPLPSLPQKLEKKAIYFRELFPPQSASQE